MSNEKDARLEKLNASMKSLTEGQLHWLEGVIAQFGGPTEFSANPTSDIISEDVLRDFGDVLRIHHSFSREAFSKDKFEYALEDVFRRNGVEASLAPRGSRGFDLTIGKSKVSLKTQADKSIKEKYLHISKFMELGHGEWTDKEEDLIGLRQQFLTNVQALSR